ncbi:NAD(P)/FAD-dependent oxidoreductase [Parapusillimonas granuli]|uniref:NAD(P)/FAD-dependent oxidoreductase n=1 Tax=Parapusillimonas granuli TaxID=380911 RepID=A0A853FZB2_9BURK|nr:NAD(P)/FAD-dependent oxidoreductase [Parapusillimonas granuli]MBB5215379.1 NADH dehydrogenase [Parapusillimonas granuli]MEB2400220.1 NAD(P)/FAD-dependent oxidoreductase [Alcaligenaceae bacterium]NYT49953.1 NAD(P)/FAD-dependent oxidoreductase [Parapusillimonas granuli]
MPDLPHSVVIVGGGAGGLELAARLGRKFGPSHVVLIDKAESHIWKPSLHEVAAGTLDIHREDLSYFMLARESGFTFIQGEMHALDRNAREVLLLSVAGSTGLEIFPARRVGYDTLVLAIGSRTNFFGTPGAREHAITLDSTEQAERFRQRLLNLMVRRIPAGQHGDDAGGAEPPGLDIAIVGAGATGVELAAELLEARAGLAYYGLHGHGCEMRITLIEGADRILSALPPKLSFAAQSLLESRGVEVLTGLRIAGVSADHLSDQDGRRYPTDLCVWAAGIEAPAMLGELGLETNRVNQLVVDAQLRTADPRIYAFGDCAQAPWIGQNSNLPARAQVAHQQAAFLYDAMSARIRGAPAPSRGFAFRDYGSLVSIGHNRGVGNLMGVLSGKSWFVEGLVARLMYMSLHLTHHLAVLGFGRTAALALGRLLLKRGTPRVKLH